MTATIKPLGLRQRQLAELISQGKLDKEIAHEMRISPGTVKAYLRDIRKKLGARLIASNRVGLAVWWVTEGRAGQ